MNRFLYLFALLILGAALLPACSKKNDVETGKPLIVACEASTSPYCYYRGKDANPPVAGVDIDIIEAIGKELGRPVRPHLPRRIPQCTQCEKELIHHD